MAFSDFLIRIGLDSSRFSQGSRRMSQDTSAVRQSIATLNATLARQVQSMNTMVRQGRQGTALFQQLTREIRQTENALRMAQRQINNTERSFGGLNMSQLGGALTGGLIGGGVAGAAMMGAQKLQQAFQETLQVTTSFDDAIRKVGATSRASASQMEDLRNAAIEMGSKTRFTASESAQALNYMALAGWKTEQSISALPGVLNLAAAAGTDLAMTSDILTDTMSAFGIEAKDSTKVADVFAQVQSKANTTVEMLGEAMKYAAPQFASAGQSIETTSTIIGLLANQGIKASMAGTAMNAMLKDVKKGAEDGVLAFGSMNIQLYDQQGNMRSLIDIIREMRQGVQGLTQQQRDAITGGLFEERAIKAVNILLNSTDEVINDLANSVDVATGRSEEMANQMEGGVGGALRKMQSAWEGFQLTVAGDAGFAKIWYDGWAAVFTNWTDEVNRLSREWQVFKRGFEIGWIDAENERKQLDAIAKFSGAYKQALDGMPMDKLTDQMTRLTNASQFQAEAEAKRNATILAGLAPRKHDEQITEETEKKTTKLAAAVKTATDVYADLQKELASSAEYHRIIGDEIGGLAERYALLERAISQAWKAGGKDAEKVVRDLKRQQEEMTAERMVATVAPLSAQAIAPVQSLVVTPKFQIAKKEDLTKFFNELKFQFNDEMVKANLLQGAFGDVDMIATEMQSLGQLIAEGLEAGLDQSMLQGYIDKWKELSVEQQKQQAFASVVASIGDSAYQAFESIGAGAMSASEGVRAFGVAAISASLDAARGALVESIMNNAARLTKVLGPIGIPLAVAASSALFGLLKGAIGKSKGVRLAEGGIISGRTMAER